MSNEPTSNESGNTSRRNVFDLIESVGNFITRDDSAEGAVSKGESMAVDFELWVGDQGYYPVTPPEWFEAWAEYCEQYGEESGPDDDDIGGVDEAQEWHDYDPDC